MNDQSPQAVTVRVEDTPPPNDGYNSALIKAEANDPRALASIARERFELEALVAMARSHPRDELECFTRMSNAAKRPTFAAKAEYRYQRGGKPVVGVSVAATRPLASYWGHMRSGWKIVQLDEDGYHIQGFAHDVQSGAVRTQEHIGKWTQQRKNRDTGRVEWLSVTDERERREIMGKSGSILERNCVLAIIPPDIVEDVVNECRKTNVSQAKGDLAKNRVQTIRAVVASFGEYGVTSAMLEAKVGHPLEQLNEEELAEFRTIYNSLREGEPIASFFDQANGRPRQPQTGTLDLSKAKAAEPQDPKGGSTIGDVSKKPDAPLSEAEMAASDAKAAKATEPKTEGKS